MKSDNDLISTSLVGGVACSGQLSRCHFDRNEVEWSGEISFLNGMGTIAAGDFSAQSFNEPKAFTTHTGVQLRSK